MELTGFLPLVRRWWPLLLLSAVAAGAAAYALASRLAPTYEAQASLLTGPINTDYGTLRASGELARTYAELARSGGLVTEAAEEVGVEGTREELQLAVTATANQVTRIVSVRVRDEDPERATAFANAVAERLTRLAAEQPPQELESVDELLRSREIEGFSDPAKEQIRTAVTRVFSPPPEGRLAVVDAATVPTTPVGPAVQLLTVLGAFAGLVAAGIFVLLRESSRDAIHDEQELGELVDVPVLGSVTGGRSAQPGLVVGDMPESPAAADYRVLAAKIAVFEEDASIRSLLVVAADDAGGSGTVAANLAAALSEGNAHVTLVDANTVEGEITTLLDLNDQRGYGDIIRRNEDGTPAVEDVDGLRVRRGSSLDILPRGTNGGPDVLEPDQARLLLESLLDDSDVVVLNAPPIERSPSTLVWARAADATVLAVRRGKSKRETVADAVKTLSVVGGNLIGTVFRDSRGRLPFGR